MLLVHINSPIHAGVPEGRRCFCRPYLLCAELNCALLHERSELWALGVSAHDLNRNACHLISLVLCQMKGEAEDGLCALNPTALCLAQSLRKCSPPPSRVMDHLPNAKTKKRASVKKRNASFYLPLSFCAPCSLSSTPFPNISYLSSSQYPILRPENNAFVLLPPPHPSIHLCGALCDISAMPGYEGEREGQAPPLSPRPKPTEYQ